LKLLGEEFEGRHHNGLDDAKNIAKIVLKILRNNFIVTVSGKLLFDPEDQKQNEIRILTDKKACKFDLATVEDITGKECLYLVYPNVVCGYPPSNDVNDYKFANNLAETYTSEGEDSLLNPSLSPASSSESGLDIESDISPPTSLVVVDVQSVVEKGSKAKKGMKCRAITSSSEE
jgi:hypothetical protein